MVSPPLARPLGRSRRSRSTRWSTPRRTVAVTVVRRSLEPLRFGSCPRGRVRWPRMLPWPPNWTDPSRAAARVQFVAPRHELHRPTPFRAQLVAIRHELLPPHPALPLAGPSDSAAGGLTALLERDRPQRVPSLVPHSGAPRRLGREHDVRCRIRQRVQRRPIQRTMRTCRQTASGPPCLERRLVRSRNCRPWQPIRAESHTSSESMGRGHIVRASATVSAAIAMVTTVGTYSRVGQTAPTAIPAETEMAGELL